MGSSVNALYNIITRAFIGHADYLGDEAMSAMGIALPVMLIIAAFGMLVGAGAGSRISIFLGNGDEERAERVVGTSLLLTLIITLSVSLTLRFFLPQIVPLLGADEATYQYTYDFLTIFLYGAIFSTLCFSFNNMMRASGYPRKAMYTMLLTLLINAILAPLFIYLFHWGIKGAALSIVISMFCGTLFVLHHFLYSSKTIRLKGRYIRLEGRIVRAILSIGMSPFMMNIVSSSIVFLMIQQVRNYGGSVGVAAYTIVNVMLMLVVMILLGLTQGMQPIVGYSYGAGQLKRLREVLLYTMKIGIGVGVVAMLIGQFAPQLIIAPFNPSKEVGDATISAVKIMTILFPLVGFQVVVTIYFQSIGKVRQSIFLSLSRQLIFLVPALLLLPNHFGLNGVWASVPFADLLAALLAALFISSQLKNLRRHELALSERELGEKSGGA